ncbi:ATP-binding protein [Stenotrophomonas sp. PFBMAA-4]|uniref:sensor histidine kinase n=1 Tax=Stenotrophomonas sp. PFBMAA-4 TaxID=3043301 RepID=UPI0024B5F6A5|nr:ATP-binding protein [Stenotrophomonas sp. PFBMAA-4]MDI9272437.1 ATP-binding protein [Stenotrophomonas sp. PFBMAA-4]
MISTFLSWLDKAPLADPVDRRNARVVQGLMLFMGITIPAMVCFAIAIAWPYLSQAETHWATYASLGMSLSIGAVAWTGLWLIRRGAFRLSVQLLVGILLAVSIINLGVNGLQRQIADQLAQMLVLLLSGLILGRRPLWITLAILVAGTLLGATRDALGPLSDAPERAFFNLPPLVFTYLLVSILIDRTTQALRETLRESNNRGHRLAEEMQQREKAHSQLIHAQKKEITERLASGMAHDFNNIFAVIIGFANHCREDEGDSITERVRQLENGMNAVEESARRGMAVSRRLLRFNRRDNDNPEPFDAWESIQALEQMLRQLLGPGTQLILKGSREPATVLMDRSQFELMLLNIASNAADAMGSTGRFSIQTSSTGHWVHISLEDSGSGMPTEVAARVFEPFFSTKPADSGTGLGMAVVHELVTKAGGTITVQSTPDIGTVFSINLPRCDQG